MQRPTRFQIMRARREENERWERVQRQRAVLESHLDEYDASVLARPDAPLPCGAAPLAKINECERKEAARWRLPEGAHAIAPATLPPEPQHEPGWISRLFVWWRYG